ncbi:MAG: hypothetical protein HEQ23_16550 [Tepidisphaera sp.]|jgi:predicted transcriptional regulator
MKLSAKHAKVMAEALKALRAGNGRKFDDVLWLGLGDGCAEAYTALTRHGYIANEADIEQVQLTDRGVLFLHKLTESIVLVA